MKNPVNTFKAGLKAGKHQLGIWNAIPGSAVTEQLATFGFDWLLIDTEHSPIDVLGVLPALQAVAAYPETAAVVRPAVNDTALIKRLLDLGAQTLLLPYIQSVEEAQEAVQAIRYAPKGARGFAGMIRANRFGTVDDYATRAEEELCLLLQVETVTALDALEEIASVDGVDGIFIGPADLAASMGHPGDSEHPEVVAAIDGAFERLAKIGVPSGILTVNPDYARHCIDAGTAFTAVGVDMALLHNAVGALKSDFRSRGA